MTKCARAVRTGEAERGGPRRLAVACACVVALTLWLPAVAHSTPSFPRLANIYFGSLGEVDLELLSRWDLLVLSKRAEDIHQAQLAELRALNPDAELLAHMAVGYGRDFTEPPINADLSAALDENNWWMKDTSGERVVFGPGNIMMNMSLDCPMNAQGQRLCDWLPGYIAERLYSGGRWDGLFLDYAVDRVAWLDAYLPFPIDHDLDGQPADAEVLNESWRLGMRACVQGIRELAGDDYLLVANGNNTLYDLCDGDTREDFPEMHGDWHDNMMDEEHGYLAFESLYRQPPTNIINTIWSGEVTPEGPARWGDFDREFLLGLTSTLVFGNGYFSCDGPAHTEAWWIEYYDVELGEALSRAEDVEVVTEDVPPWVDLMELIKKRSFEHGIAVINPTLWIQEIDLGGAYYDIHSWNGHFYPHSGMVTRLTLGWETGEILAGPGVVVEHRIDAVVASVRRSSVVLTWDPVDGAASYSVYRRKAVGDGTFSPKALVAVVEDTIYTDNEISGGGYLYYVAPIDEHKCEGRQSRAIGVSTEPGSDLSTALMVDEHGGRPALHTALTNVRPLPATERTLVSFTVADDERWGDSTPTTLSVYDVSGRVVRRLESARLAPGEHVREWDLRNESGARVASGCYVIVLEGGGTRTTSKALVLR